jgi:hypothetical protein
LDGLWTPRLDIERLEMEHRHTFQRDPCDEYAWQEAEIQAMETLKVFAFYFQKTFAVVEFREEARVTKVPDRNESCFFESSHQRWLFISIVMIMPTQNGPSFF